jgi:hypothetical protein
MTRDGLQRALIDLGWLALIQRALWSKPSSSYALYQLMRCAGRPVTVAQLREEYAGACRSLGRAHSETSGTRDACCKRIERLRACLDDLGAADAVQTIVGAQAYQIDKRDLPRIERALLFACGIELEADVQAA